MVFTAHKIVKYFPAWNSMRMGIFSFLVRVKYNLNEKCKGHNENNDDSNSDNNNGSRISNDAIDFLTKEVNYNC